jgi:hypothetical protein
VRQARLGLAVDSTGNAFFNQGHVVEGTKSCVTAQPEGIFGYAGFGIGSTRERRSRLDSHRLRVGLRS